MNRRYKKCRSKRTEILKKLVLVLHEIYPTGETQNPFYRLKLEDYPSEYLHYHQLLSHYFTLIHQNNRAMEKSRYITSREDIMASLQVLEIVTLKQYRSEKKTADSILEVLQDNTREGQILTARQISEIIGYKKTQTARIIKILLEMNKIEKVSHHHKSIGYLYKLS
jgi:DNA-binding MarR family transcriptional regulator